MFTSNSEFVLYNIENQSELLSIKLEHSHNFDDVLERKPDVNLLCIPSPIEPTSFYPSNVYGSYLPEYSKHKYDPQLSPPHSFHVSSPQSINSDDSLDNNSEQLNLEKELKQFEGKWQQYDLSMTNKTSTITNIPCRPEYKCLDAIDNLKPSDIVQYLLAKPSVFVNDTRRLEHLSHKCIPKESILPQTSIKQFGPPSCTMLSNNDSFDSFQASSSATTECRFLLSNCSQPIESQLLNTDLSSMTDPKTSVAQLKQEEELIFTSKTNYAKYSENSDYTNIKIENDEDFSPNREKNKECYEEHYENIFHPTNLPINTLPCQKNMYYFQKEEEKETGIEQFNRKTFLEKFKIKKKDSMETVSTLENQKNGDVQMELSNVKKINQKGNIQIINEFETIKPLDLSFTRKRKNDNVQCEHTNVKKMKNQEANTIAVGMSAKIKPLNILCTVNNVEDKVVSYIFKETVETTVLSIVETHKIIEPKRIKCKTESLSTEKIVNISNIKNVKEPYKNISVSKSNKVHSHESGLKLPKVNNTNNIATETSTINNTNNNNKITQKLDTHTLRESNKTYEQNYNKNTFGPKNLIKKKYEAEIMKQKDKNLMKQNKTINVVPVLNSPSIKLEKHNMCNEEKVSLSVSKSSKKLMNNTKLTKQVNKNTSNKITARQSVPNKTKMKINIDKKVIKKEFEDLPIINEPYVSMYDKVKARSSKRMLAQEETSYKNILYQSKRKV